MMNDDDLSGFNIVTNKTRVTISYVCCCMLKHKLKRKQRGSEEM